LVPALIIRAARHSYVSAASCNGAHA
jgi:hypothetical protein